jgi:glycine/D-amino acid oxidase-like deaminating enzyme
MLDPDDLSGGKADVVVVGGGVIGTAITYFLAKCGVDVCLVERGDIGAGTSSAAAAAALLQTKTSSTKLALARKSLSLLDDLHQEFDESFEFDHSGSLLAASNEAELVVIQDMIKGLQALSLDVQFADGDQARAIMPLIGPGVIGASYSPVDAKVNPLELVTSYAQSAQRLGATLCTFTEVMGVRRQADRVVSVRTSRGEIFTDTVVDAAGVWAPHLAGMVGVELPITPLKGELMVTEPLPPTMRGTLISARYLLSKSKSEVSQAQQGTKRSVGITLVQVDHGNLVVGSTREEAGYDRRSTYAGLAELCRQLVDLVPSVANIHIIRSYAGLRPIAPDGLPIIGRLPDLPGFIVAAGHGGDGLILSAITAEMVTQIYNGEADPSDIALFSVDRFAKQEKVL